MKKKFKKHLWYYISLILFLSASLILLIFANQNIKLQSGIILTTVIVYIFWGVLHHFMDHRLTAKIMIEYILIGVLGLAVLFFIMMGGPF